MKRFSNIPGRLQKGFTLVEMAIVLVIIGLIIAAVSVGKDAQRNAENKKIYQKFVSGWAESYNQYYERTGVVMGDTPSAPTGAAAAAGTSLTTILDTVGIAYPSGAGAAARDQYVYFDHQGLPHNLTISFTKNAADNGSGIAGNVMKIEKVTGDLARALDVAIDGLADGKTGTFRNSDKTKDWADAKAEGTAEPELTAYWKMTQ